MTVDFNESTNEVNVFDGDTKVGGPFFATDKEDAVDVARRNGFNV